MIIGNGDIASVLSDRKNRLYFASGVSNSAETRESEYQREIDLLVKQNLTQHIVYFSSLCVFYSNTRYASHKRQMEGLVSAFKTYTIIRLGNITWGINPHTIINYFRSKIAQGEAVEVKDVYRYVVDKEEFLYWIDLIPAWSCEMNIPGRRMKVKEILNDFTR